MTVAVTSEKQNVQVQVEPPTGITDYAITCPMTTLTHRRVGIAQMGARGLKNFFTLTAGSYESRVLLEDLTTGAKQTSTVSFYVN